MSRPIRTLITTAALLFGVALSSLFAQDNCVKLLPKGEVFYKELSSALQDAQSYIYFEYYSVGRDSVSFAMLDLLTEKVKQGVTVYAMIDGHGSFHRANPMDWQTIAEYREKGLDIAVFNPSSVSAPLPRDHRKLTVIDGRTAFVGGMNIHDYYIHGSPELGQVVDFTIRIDGPAAKQLEPTFKKSWNDHSDHKKQRHFDLESEAPNTSGNETILTIMATEGIAASPTVRDNYLKLIGSAQHSIRLVNAYFMPCRSILKALKKAAARGVKVDLLIGANTDLPIMKDKPYKLTEKMARTENIRTHWMTGSFVHEKAISIDSEEFMVGSTNLDLLSRKINYELSVLIKNAALTAAFDENFDSRFRE